MTEAKADPLRGPTEIPYASVLPTDKPEIYSREQQFVGRALFDLAFRRSIIARGSTNPAFQQMLAQIEQATKQPS